MAIIYNGEVLVAHHNPGDTSYLLITLIGLYHENDAETDYLMRELVEREGITCIGITTRLRNFYLHDEMHEIAALVRRTRRSGQMVIVIGQSSAGYAAVKFADLLGADQVLAFSPIFSAHEADLGLTEDMQREIGFLRGAVRMHRIEQEVVRPGMRPGPEDCSAKLAVIYDTANESDAWAATCYANMFPQTRTVRFTNLGHETLDHLQRDQSHLLLTILDRLMRGDEDGAFEWLKYLSRRSETAITALMVQIARWRPSELERALRTERAQAVLTPDVRQRHQFNDICVYEFVRRRQTGAALARLREILPILFTKQDPPECTSKFLVMSYHGDLMTLERGGKKVTMTPRALFDDECVLLILDTSHDHPRVLMQMRDGEQAVTLDPGSAVTYGEGFEIVPVPDSGLVAFRRGNAFLKADYRSAPLFASAAILAWECYALIPVNDPEALARRFGINWFDQVSQGMADQTTKGTTATRRTAFRSLLQRYFS